MLGIGVISLSQVFWKAKATTTMGERMANGRIITPPEKSLQKDVMKMMNPWVCGNIILKMVRSVRQVNLLVEKEPHLIKNPRGDAKTQSVRSDLS